MLGSLKAALALYFVWYNFCRMHRSIRMTPAIEAGMPLTYESLNAFVTKHGSVRILDTEGKTKILMSGDPDVFDLYEKADWFLFKDRWYGRAEFEKIAEESQL